MKEIVDKFEERVKEDLRKYLLSKGAIDEHFPECPDVEEKWSEIAREYLPDGAREFKDYPAVSLGWMMFIGMAMVYYWDTDWEANAKRNDFYAKLRDLKGYDNLDETVVRDLYKYEGEGADKVIELVAECAQRVLSLLNREQVEPGTEMALGCYIAALHQLYLAGMGVGLCALGYHMTPMGQA